MNFSLRLLPDDGRGYFTGMCHVVEHEWLENWVKTHKERGQRGIHIEVAYDTKKIEL
jgi:hypothetical protein